MRRSARFRQGALGVERTEHLALRVEAKLTGHPSYSFRVQDWWDIARSSARVGEAPLLAIHFARDRESLAVLRAALATELGLLPPGVNVPIVQVTRQCTLRPSVHQLLRVPRPAAGAAPPRQEALLATPYEAFIARLRDYEARAADASATTDD